MKKESRISAKEAVPQINEEAIRQCLVTIWTACGAAHWVCHALDTHIDGLAKVTDDVTRLLNRLDKQAEKTKRPTRRKVRKIK